MTKTTIGPNGAKAVLSDDEVYRYYLTRNWNPEHIVRRTLGVIMLNPSTADAFTDDRTIKKVMGYADQWGYNSISVANIFAYRTPYPADLKYVTDDQRCGPDNAYYIWQVFTDAHDKILCGWGSNALAAPHIPGFWYYFCKFSESSGAQKQLVSVKTTNKGMPMHPLYQRNDLEPRPWNLAI